MLAVYVPRGGSLERIEVAAEAGFPEGAVWIDLLDPTLIEDKLVEQATGVAIPTREEMQEIEVTSRLYVENGVRYMTATLMCQAETDSPKTAAVTFILSGHKLITVRYDEPRPFAIVNNKLCRLCPPNPTGETVMMDLLDAVIDRAADILERIGADVDHVSRDIFDLRSTVTRTRHFNRTFISIGRKGDLTSKVRESLVSIGRLLLFLASETEDSIKLAKEQRTHLKGMQRDVQSLSDHATYLSNKIQFLLDAMVGVVNLQQNNIIKIFSVVAVVLMPPTLIASIYGMNFRHMPELEWTYGYPFTLVLMLVAAILPYLFFKWKKWL